MPMMAVANNSSRTSTTTAYELFFAGNCALNTATEANMKRNMNLFASGCASFGLIINMDKTVITYQPTSNSRYNVACLYVNGIQLETVDNFAFLGSILFHSVKVNDNLAHAISKASQAFGRS
nr:unnamed protein product [Spirometra erinaceieuropaei]